MEAREASRTRSRTDREDFQATADPALIEAADTTAEVRLLTYAELYSLWERQQWQTQELDFTQDRIDIDRAGPRDFAQQRRPPFPGRTG